jgi:hypothetical protein
MPRKVLLAFAAALVAIAAPAVAGASGYSLLDYQSATDALLAVDPTIDPPPNDPSNDFAVGGFQGQENNNFGFSAHSTPLGEEPQGKLSETIPRPLTDTGTSTYQARFSVTCLAVVGKDAAIGLVPTDAASNDQHAQFVLSVHDSGLPGGTFDRYALLSDVGVVASDCALYVLEALDPAAFFIERGNILVNDAPP